ncbi:hypothetical protein RB623_13750 [Mesorhizobium sp. LHD-90]|uniref:hypothetical protein n=1 Tax=Mesorhizobium sp. LHD-90 TaxID=3071414 RepID=UPI0027E213E5|nr:hypothetical protein [Mesorhizobium sp. LHD-90]MDQ6435116.1 hypothetical protein [Mesorhizobium sp. LHD-90]
MVIRYSYLWANEHDAGREEGRKDRPCAIIVSVETDEGTTSVVVLPISHSPPAGGVPAIEIPLDTKRRLGLDDERSWVVLSEANQFVWPGFDLRFSKPGDASSVAYGEMPANFFRDLRAAFVKVLREKRARLVSRTQ